MKKGDKFQSYFLSPITQETTKSLVKKYKHLKDGPLKDSIAGHLFCSPADGDISCLKRVDAFLKVKNTFTPEVIKKILVYNEDSPENKKYKQTFLWSVFDIFSVDTGDIYKQSIKNLCLEEIFALEDGEELCFPSCREWDEELPAYKESKKAKKRYIHYFLSIVKDEQIILKGLKKRSFEEQAAGQAVLRLLELKKDEVLDGEWAKDFFQSFNGELSQPSFIFILAVLAKTFPDFPTLEYVAKEIFTESWECIILCFIRGEEWREKNQVIIKELLSPREMRNAFYATLFAFQDLPLSLPAREFILTCLRFGYYGDAMKSAILQENKFCLNEEAMLAQIKEIQHILNTYIEEDSHGNNKNEVADNVVRFIKLFRNKQTETPDSEDDLPKEWIRIKEEWSEMYKKIGTIIVETRDEEALVMDNMVL